MVTNFLFKSCLILGATATIACGKPSTDAHDTTLAVEDTTAITASGASDLIWTDTCGALEPYKQALPQDEAIGTLKLVERGCKQPTSIGAVYGTGQGSIHLLIDILDSTKIELPGGGQLHKMNIDGAKGLIDILKSQIQVASIPGASISAEERKQIPMAIKLPNGQEGIIYYEGGWVAMAVINGKYILKIELADPEEKIVDTQAAKTQLMPVVNKVNYTVLQ